jgi:hypothetical protein
MCTDKIKVLPDISKEMNLKLNKLDFCVPDKCNKTLNIFSGLQVYWDVRRSHSVKGKFYEMPYYAFRVQYIYFRKYFLGKRCTDNKEKIVINFSKVHGSQSSTVASEKHP